MSYVIERARRNSDVRCRPQPCIDVKAVRSSSLACILGPTVAKALRRLRDDEAAQVPRAAASAGEGRGPI